jgi:hypothetical protein
VQAHGYAIIFEMSRMRQLQFQKLKPTSIFLSLMGSPKVSVCKLTVFLKRVEINEGVKYERMKFRKRGHFINLTEKRLDIKNCL